MTSEDNAPDLGPFQIDATCQMCGSNQIAMRFSYYHREELLRMGATMKRICKVCAFSWHENLPTEGDKAAMGMRKNGDI